MKVAILHHDLEWAEKKFNEIFNSLGIESKLYDIRKVSLKDLEKNDFILNRIYASVANRDCVSNISTLELLKELESKGIPCINSGLTTKMDYDKYAASKIMNQKGILNPETILIERKENMEKAINFAKEKKYPVILKRVMGGRGKDVILIENEKELKENIERLFSKEGQYNQGYVIQEFMENNRGYDCRIAVIDGKFGFSFSRSLINTKEGEIKWLASTSKGSKKEKYNPSKEEMDLAIKATKTINAIFNEVDMTFTEKGPAIIENNPTPNYVEGQDLDKLTIAAKLILKKFKEMKNESNN